MSDAAAPRPLVNQRSIRGGFIMAKAVFVTSVAECARRYGAHAMTKMLPGIVSEVLKVKNCGNGRNATFVVADFCLGGETVKRCKLTKRKVVSSECSDAHARLMQLLEAPPTEENTSTILLLVAPFDGLLVAPPHPAALDDYDVAFSNNHEDHEEVDERKDKTTTDGAPGDDPPRPSITVHDTTWYHDDTATTQQDFNGPILPRDWRIRDVAGNLFGPPVTVVNTLVNDDLAS